MVDNVIQSKNVTTINVTVKVRTRQNIVYTKKIMLVIYNHFHHILRLFYVLPNCPFTKSEAKRDY